MAKNKLQHFEENSRNQYIVQPRLGFPPVGFELKGKWNKEFFKNDNPIILELGCGKGEYTVHMAKRFPNANFIGVDIKGARIWRGGTDLLEQNITNGAFLRVMVDQIDYYFETEEVSEIWITFPDPQKEKERKRLTAPLFLDRYRRILKKDGRIHLKTDSHALHTYTIETIEVQEDLILEEIDSNVYSNGRKDVVTEVQTFYESKYLKKGIPITYLKIGRK